MQQNFLLTNHSHPNHAFHPPRPVAHHHHHHHHLAAAAAAAAAGLNFQHQFG